ncbi:hypothetical protein Emag_004017 [Eimeria magna]
MKRGLGVEPHPAKGPLQIHASTTPVREAAGKGALEAPVKPRSNTVATFLRPQPPLAPENTSDSHRPSTSGIHTSLHHARLHDRRNALIGDSRRSNSPDIKEICARYRPPTGSSVLSGSTATSGSSSSAWQRESSLKTARKTGISHRRLSASARSTGLSYKQSSTGAPEPPKEAPVAPLKPGPASTTSMESSCVPPFEAFAMHDPLRPSAQERESLLVPGEGRAYHLGVQQGELHNRILTVGHAGRADWLAERFLDPQMRTLSLKSNRNFRLHSGFYKRKPVSIVAVGMGAPMMDVLVREASYITEGPLAIVRLGTCTLLDQELRPGSIVVASQGSLGCYTNYAYFDGTAVDNLRTQELRPYTITRPCAADPELSRLIFRHAAALAPDSVFEGLNASAETFYSCQAREDQLFRDDNEDLLETLLRCGAQTMEMETHQLLHLASRRIEMMKAAAVHVGVTSRTNDHFMHPITPSQLNELVGVAGKACLDALVDVTI